MAIQVVRSSMPLFEEYAEEIKPLWESRWLSNRGVVHKKFEKMLQDYLKCPNPALFANGHVALEVAINGFDFPAGSEVITTAYTHCSTTHSIVRNGLTPVFCDVNSVDYTIDAGLIEAKITPKTVAIVATHVYGLCCDVDKIAEIADKHHLKVIYDAAHAFGVEKDGVGIASFGDAAMFSCHATKVFHTIEGGITVFKDQEMRNKVERLINFGFISPEEVAYVSTNARMNEFEAAMGICNLRHIDDEIGCRKVVADQYIEMLGDIPGIRLLRQQPGVKPNFAYFPVFFDGYRKDRNQAQAELAQHNVFARKYFYPLVTDLQCYRGQFASSTQETPRAYQAAESVLALPMYSGLSPEEVEEICKIILA